MECQLRSMSDANGATAEPTVPEGKVESVCREWLVREDGVLAYKLQSEEIQHHYGHNKERNQIVRSDIQEARIIQRSEVEEAEMMQRAYEQMLQEQEDADALIAKQLQDKLLQEESEKQKHIEEEDKRIALELQKKEKLRLQKKREERELRQVEKARAQSTSNGSSDSLPRSVQGLSLNSTQEASTSPLDQDFTDLCLEPPSNLSQEEQRRFREEQDAELAKFLQQQEMRTRKQNCQDQQMAIEAQDRELARVLQEQERARAKRAKERAKQKAMHQQQQQQQDGMNTIEEAQIHYSFSPDNADDQASQEESRMKDSDWFLDHRKSSGSSYSGHPLNNIAMVIDPTYNPKKSTAESPTLSQVSVPNSPLPSPEHCNADGSPYGAGCISENFYLNAEDEESVAPPYMPIQGQRRPLSLEKGKKCKKNKDGCKTQ